MTFATVRHRTKVTKEPGSKAAGIAIAFKLIEAADWARRYSISFSVNALILTSSPDREIPIVRRTRE